MRAPLRAIAVAVTIVAIAIPASIANAAPLRSNAVAIPYLGEIAVKPAESWTFTDCASILAATPLAVSCDASTLTFRAGEYDPGFGQLRVPVTSSNGRTTLTVDYLVSLEPPPVPEFEDLDYDYPFAAGSRVLVPLSDLAIACGLCAETGGVGVIAASVSPSRAGTVAVTATHLVLSATPSFVGSAELRVRAVDDIGQESQTGNITVHLYAPGERYLAASHVSLPFAGDAAAPTEIDLGDLVHGEDGTIIGCGAAVSGTVVCRPDGTASYSPRAGAAPAIDQFSFHVADDAGEQATGSVTLVRADAAVEGLRVPGMAPGVGREKAKTVVPAAAIGEAAPAESVGVVSRVGQLLDRVGA